jgi:hypothetical protein
MGPGYVPLALGLVLVALGLAIVVKAYVAPDPASAETHDGGLRDAVVQDGPASDGRTQDAVVPDREMGEVQDADAPDPRPLAGLQWRPLVAIFGAVLFFALTVDGLGLLPATFGTGLLAALARPGTRLVRALVIAVSLMVASWIIFVVLLQLRLSLLGDWLGG